MDPTPSISDLPESLLHEILKLLPPKDAIRASATSRSWRSAWISSKVLAFDESIVPFKQSDFLDYVNRSLDLWCQRCDNRVNMEKFYLSADVTANVTTDEFFTRFVELVSVATSRNVKVIELRSYSDLYCTIFYHNSLWSLLSACQSLKVLSLSGFLLYLPIPSLIPEMSSVKKFTLTCSSIGDISLRNVLSSMPLLEDLVVKLSMSYMDLWISCPKLKTFEVTLCDNVAQSIVIDAPNLQYFFYHRTSNPLGSVSFMNCKLLMTLHIERAEFRDANVIDEYLSQIPLLENLMLKNCLFPGGGIQISHSNLKSLKLRNNQGLKKADINTPNLQCFKFLGGIFHLSSFTYSSGLLNAHLMLATSSFECTKWIWFIELRNFLRSFKNCKVLSLNCYLEGCVEELRGDNMLPDPFNELTHLSITNLSLTIANYPAFLKAMVELFPCVETLFLKTMNARISIEFDEDRHLNSTIINIFSSNSDEYDTICQSIKEATDNIVEFFDRQKNIILRRKALQTLRLSPKNRTPA